MQRAYGKALLGLLNTDITTGHGLALLRSMNGLRQLRFGEYVGRRTFTGSIASVTGCECSPRADHVVLSLGLGLQRGDLSLRRQQFLAWLRKLALRMD